MMFASAVICLLGAGQLAVQCVSVVTGHLVSILLRIAPEDLGPCKITLSDLLISSMAQCVPVHTSQRLYCPPWHAECCHCVPRPYLLSFYNALLSIYIVWFMTNASNPDASSARLAADPLQLTAACAPMAVCAPVHSLRMSPCIAVAPSESMLYIYAWHHAPGQLMQPLLAAGWTAICQQLCTSV